MAKVNLLKSGVKWVNNSADNPYIRQIIEIEKFELADVYHRNCDVSRAYKYNTILNINITYMHEYI